MEPASIAVIVPFYGRLADLRECLASVLAQTWTDWQCVVVDDLSPESSDACRAEFADPRIRIVRHEVNRGLAAARNTAVRATDAPLVLPLDSDDVLPADALERLIGPMQVDPKIDCTFGDFDVFGAVSQRWRWAVRDAADLARVQWLPGPGVLLRRSLWERAGGWCEDAVFRAGNEDWDFWLSVAATGPLHAVHAQAVTYRYRRRPGSMSLGALPPKDWLTRIAMVQRHPALFSEPGSCARFVRQGLHRGVAAHLAAGRIRQACELAVRAARLAVPIGSDAAALRI